MFTTLKRLLVGRPISSAERDHQRLIKLIALAIFSSDAISSTAYATEEILHVLVPKAGMEALEYLIPISFIVIVLLAIVAVSYRQTIFAYPGGGGSYVVSRENLGPVPAQVAAASLLTDYVLTVAVSVSAGVAAITSAIPELADQRIPMCLLLVALITVGNLRGIKESGQIFAVPTYIYLVALTLLCGIGLFRSFTGGLDPLPVDQESLRHFTEGTAVSGVTLFALMRAFSSGAVALTGVEAISNAVPLFKRPEAKNAANTLMMMVLILGGFFFAISVLTHRLQPTLSENETILSILGGSVFGRGSALYILLQSSTAVILILAANTAYNAFPSVASIIAKDGYLPRQLFNRGDRLVFSNGVLLLSVAASGLLIAFGGVTTALIPLYAVGVFLSFTLSQWGMVQHHRKGRLPGWKRGAVINTVGAIATGIVLMVVVISKFTIGAWVPVVVIPFMMVLFAGVKRHYVRVRASLEVPVGWKPPRLNHTVVVLVGGVHRGVLESLAYARSLAPNHLVAVSVVSDEEEQEAISSQWAEYGVREDLEIVYSPYRELSKPVMRFLDELDQRWANDVITVLIPEFVVHRWWEQLLHNQTALFLKGKLLFREGVVVTSIPYHLRDRSQMQTPESPSVVWTTVKRLLVGKPLRTAEEENRRLIKLIALAVFSSDAISSTAYATEEILHVLVPQAGMEALRYLIPISLIVMVLLAVVALSYRQTIFAYPGGGGSYTVARENLGTGPSLVAAGSMLTDYVLTVAVSISAGVAAIASAVPEMKEHRVGLGLGLIALITLANLRGLKEAGTAFAAPTYLYIIMLGMLVVWGLYRSFTGDLSALPTDTEALNEFRPQDGAFAGVTVFALMRAFSSGAVALTGVEAISIAVPAFRKPSAKNAAKTLVVMVAILGTFFFAISVLAHRLRPTLSEHETILSILGDAVFGRGTLFYVLLQASTAAILILAANTAYTAFPTMCSIIARDGYLPRQLFNRGDRLVFSNGILVLALAAAALLVGFGGVTTKLIPLYAVGVFTSFTLSQTGMVRYHLRERLPGWRARVVASGAGAFTTGAVLLVVLVSKFTYGAWVPVVLIPSMILLFRGIKAHYAGVADRLAIPPDWKPARLNHTVVVLVGGLHRGVLDALAYARSLAPNHLVAVTVVSDEAEQEAIGSQWALHGVREDLEIVYSPYRELSRPLLRYLDELDARWDNDVITVLLPEVVVRHWWQQLLHNQTALVLKGRLLFRKGVVVTSVPYHLD